MPCVEAGARSAKLQCNKSEGGEFTEEGDELRRMKNLGGVHAQFLAMVAQSSEFENMAVREDELPELDALVRSACPFDVKGGPENKHGKINILLQVSFLLCSRF